MKTSLPINNPPKTKPQAAAKRPVLPIHAGKGGLQATIAVIHSYRSLLDAADDAQFIIYNGSLSIRTFAA